MNTTQHHADNQVLRPRLIEQCIAGRATSDGAGVKLTRVLTHTFQKRLDPFLMFDAIKSESANDYMGGFPSHPHRGFETITYMISGRVLHQDSAGHQGILENGGVQWMIAGRGVIHSEMPQQENGSMEGFQLWLNLPAHHKMCDPFYHHIPKEAIPQFVTQEQVTVKVIAGTSHGVLGAVNRPITEPMYLALDLPEHSTFEQPLPADHNAFIYVYRGEASVGNTAIPINHMGILQNQPDQDGVIIHATRNARLLLVAGKPLKEPIVQWGPFVMNAQSEIAQAIADYQNGKLVQSE